MALSLGQFQKSNFLATGGVILLVAGVLFIPDMLGLQGPTISRSALTLQKALESRTTKAEVENFSEQAPRSLALRDGLRQDTLHSQEAATTLLETAEASRLLVHTLPREYKASKFALLELIDGIDTVRNGVGRTLSGEDALIYLNNLDYDVSRAFQSEGVPASYSSTWQSLRLGANRKINASQWGRQSSAQVAAKLNGLALDDITYYRSSHGKPQVSEKNPLLVDASFKLYGDIARRATWGYFRYLEDERRKGVRISAGDRIIDLKMLTAFKPLVVEVVDDEGTVLARRVFKLGINTRGRASYYDADRRIFIYDVPVNKPLADGSQPTTASPANALIPLTANRGETGYKWF